MTLDPQPSPDDVTLLLGEWRRGTERHFREGLEIGRGLPGNANTYVGVVLRDLGRVLLLRGEPTAAEPILRESLAVQRAAFTADPRRVADSESVLGECLTALGRFDEAEPLLLAGHEKLARSVGPGHRRTLEALERIVEPYEASGRTAEADAYRQRETSK